MAANDAPTTAARTAMTNKSLMARRFTGSFIFEWIKSGDIQLVKVRVSSAKEHEALERDVAKVP